CCKLFRQKKGRNSKKTIARPLSFGTLLIRVSANSPANSLVLVYRNEYMLYLFGHSSIIDCCKNKSGIL
ncbi:hypothetical protein NYE71_32770, partial [Bacillus sp. FSL K6-0273]|uniref:hypothetical protein n=1 Tax=Bacillus sp. FSL K6-0273 TaxID=2975328 RepID=UPI0030F9F2B4